MNRLTAVALTLTVFLAGCMTSQDRSDCDTEAGSNGSRTVCKSASKFSYSRSGDNVSEVHAYAWDPASPEASLTVSLASSSGTATVTIKDSTGKTIYNRSHSYGSASDVQTVRADAEGPWSVSVNIGNLNGSVSVVLTAE